jgi:hypothetical protein
VDLLRGADGTALRAALHEAGLEERDPRALLRRASRRGPRSQVRKNPIARNEGFRCAACGVDSGPGPGAAIRNHCPNCLRSLHVDGPVPGDRLSSCHGLMDPVSWEQRGGEWRVTFRCRRCGHERRNRLYPDWADGPDDLSMLTAGTVPGA